MKLNPIVVIRQTGLLVLYTAALSLSLWLSYLLRFDFSPDPEYLARFGTILVGMLGLKLLLLLLLGQFGSLLSYFGVHDAQKIFAAMLLTALLALAVWFIGGGINYAPPRAVILTDFILSFVALCSLRMGFRMLREGYFVHALSSNGVRRHIGIIGAGDVGAALAKELMARRSLGMSPVAFFDDDRSKWNISIHGIPVKGAPEAMGDFLKRVKLDEVIIAMPSATGKRVREVVGILNDFRLKFEIVPSYAQLITGQVQISQIRPVEIQDLLGRDPVNLSTEKINDLVKGKVVMVTGAGGSIGSELCRQLTGYHPLRLLLVERCEGQMFQIEQELLNLGCGSQIVPLVADILDDKRLRSIFECFRPQLIFHAAAHKHVPMMEHQPFEAFRNNTIGTQELAKLSGEFGVERFILISTDKAINPTSAMGAAKRLAELYVQALQRPDGTSTKFMAVRFGNVLGSSGSVIPTFKKQIAAGGPVTVTHPEVTRYFMTVSEAVGLVLQSATQSQGGEIFVLDMGKSMKIVDVARQLIELSGLKPDIDIEIIFTGLRPGEKLFEETRHNTENMVPTDHPKIMRFVGEPLPLESLRQGLLNIREKAAGMDANQVKLEIQKLIPEYKPHLTTV